jgi:N-acetylglucosamine-6-phosphate deacetylase
MQGAADNLIRLITIAPEWPGAIEFIGNVVAQGVRVAIGHTAADSDTIRAAIAAGACMSTHLGNAAHDQLQRHRNYVYDQLAADELWASLIVDGHHLPADLVKVFVRAKRPERVILVSDAAMWAGLPAGIYPWGHCHVELRTDGWIGVVGQPRLAGSGLLLFRGIENVVRFAGVSLEQAVRMATDHPSQMLGSGQKKLVPQVGDDATFAVVNWDHVERTMKVRQTIIRGRTVYKDGIQ